MAKNIDVKCNFATVFAKIDNIEDLKSIANNICGQVKTAFDARVAEIKSGHKDLTVEVEVSAPVPAPQAKTNGKTVAAKKEEKPAKAKKEAPATSVTDDDAVIAIADTEAIKKLGLTFEKYNDRCWVLRGNTKPLRKALKEQFKGVFNSYLTGGEGWVFKNTSAQGVADALGLKVKVA